MIKRYSIQEIENIWSDQSKFEAFLKVELEVLRAWVSQGVIPKEDFEYIKNHASFDLERIYEIEKQTHHDVIAFTRAVTETIDHSSKKWIHYGLTSTDVVDTANGYLIKKANDIIESKIQNFLKILKKRANEFKLTPIIGRTHGVHADITSFGLKWALWYDELNRNFERFIQARKEIEVGKISGAVGNFINANSKIQDRVCKKLGLGSVAISTQVLQRDRHANYIFVIGLIGSTISKIALEIRHLQRTEVREVQEYFDVNQKGSSAMPHKRNPIASENITGLSRILNGYIHPMLEDIQLWHERDISHSSVERIILPDATNLIAYMLERYSIVLDKLIVYPNRMLENINLTNKVIFSQRVLSYLISEQHFSREDAYDLVQELAKKSWDENIDFQEILTSKLQKDFPNINIEDINELFTMEYYLSEVKDIFKRVF